MDHPWTFMAGNWSGKMPGKVPGKVPAKVPAKVPGKVLGKGSRTPCTSVDDQRINT